MEGKPSIVEQYVNTTGWKFSAIDGDPDLGYGIKCYATRQYNEKMPLDDIIRHLTATASGLEHFGVKILRKKIEHVIYDKRENK
jgi:hypothetical protein